jgi:hypothetical protein
MITDSSQDFVQATRDDHKDQRPAAIVRLEPEWTRLTLINTVHSLPVVPVMRVCRAWAMPRYASDTGIFLVSMPLAYARRQSVTKDSTTLKIGSPWCSYFVACL